MVLQLEDCIDCMKILHPDYQCVFLFDHSSGHFRKRKNGLDTSSMRKYYAGKEPSMRTTIITEELLGPFCDSINKHMVKVNEEQ